MAPGQEIQKIQSLFGSLWTDYISFNPQAKKIYDLILERERKQDPSLTELVNDHVALRTYNHPQIGLEALGRIFEKYGYRKGGEYTFVEKKLRAWHFEHANERLPKVFISELESQKLSPLVQKTAQWAADALKNQDVTQDSFLWSRRPWAASHSVYQDLLKESEYAGWMYAFGFRANHFTISVNHLKTFQGLEELNTFVKQAGYPLNSAGGEIKGTAEVFLAQSSTLAEKVAVKFDDGEFMIPACYYEFALRYPKADGRLYQGFVTTSADKIFESTNARS